MVFIVVEHVVFLVIVADLYFGAERKGAAVGRHDLGSVFFNRVVFRCRLSPMMATCSPRLISKLTSVNRGWPSNCFDKCSTVRTSFPLTQEGSRLKCISGAASAGFSTGVIFSSHLLPAFRTADGFFPVEGSQLFYDSLLMADLPLLVEVFFQAGVAELLLLSE